MASPTLRWNAAEVSGGVLTVPLDGDRPKGWKKTFGRVVTLLGGGPCGEVVCKSGKIRVTGIVEGDEESLHHFLEAAIQQTNSTLATDDEHDEPDDDEDDSPGRDVDDADERLTVAFRDFAG